MILLLSNREAERKRERERLVGKKGRREGERLTVKQKQTETRQEIQRKLENHIIIISEDAETSHKQS